jgi:glycosyltransferase involved in cell wall biosynthesis
LLHKKEKGTAQNNYQGKVWDEMEKTIRVLQVVTHMERGGLETMIMNYYRNIDRTKVQFDFLVHRDQRATYDDEIEALGGVIHRIPRLVPWSTSYRKTLNTFFAEHPQYKIVHVHQDCLSSVILMAAKKNGVPVRIGHSHNSNQDKNLKFLVKLFYKRLIPKYSTALFACGKEAGDWMFGDASYHILHNAIDTVQYRFDRSKAQHLRRSLSIPEDALVIGHVGRFSNQKNHSFLIDIFYQIVEKAPQARLILVGDGVLKPAIEEKVEKMGLKSKVFFTGLRSDVQDLMQAMDLFLFPSLYEGVPVTMIEAQAAGLPCYISDRVPIECKMTDQVRQISLEKTATEWAEDILSSANTRASDTMEAICNAGYDVKSNALWLENYYLGAI